MSDRTDFLHPDYEPGEFDRVERRLRQALAQEASRCDPPTASTTILHEAHERRPGDRGRRPGPPGAGSRRSRPPRRWP